MRGIEEVVKRAGILSKIAGLLPEKEKFLEINVLFCGVDSLLYLRNTAS